jgi:hypothetical protein
MKIASWLTGQTYVDSERWNLGYEKHWMIVLVPPDGKTYKSVPGLIVASMHYVTRFTSISMHQLVGRDLDLEDLKALIQRRWPATKILID